MKPLILVAALVLIIAGRAHSCRSHAAKTEPTKTEQTKYDKLPDGVQLTDEVREETKDKDGQVIAVKTITVAEKLKQIGAKYANDKLVDGKGREISFYRPPVRGASQGFEEDQKQRERDAKELQELQRKYSVIILYIDPRKVM